MKSFFAIVSFLILPTVGCDSVPNPSHLTKAQLSESQPTVELICQPLTSLSCTAWPEQAQVIATVSATKSLKSSQGEACEVTITPSSFSGHILCPMYETSRTVNYQVCGACPKVGTEVSGVLMKNSSGLTVLDK